MKNLRDKIIEALRDFPTDIDIRLMIRGVKTDYQKKTADRILQLLEKELKEQREEMTSGASTKEIIEGVEKDLSIIRKNQKPMTKNKTLKAKITEVLYGGKDELGRKWIKKSVDKKADQILRLLKPKHHEIEEAMGHGIDIFRKDLLKRVEGLPKYDLSKSGIDGEFYYKKDDILELLKP